MSNVYLRRTSRTGHVVITDHIVWDAQRFIASQQAEQRKLGADPKTADQAVDVEVATQAEYRAFAWPKR